MLRKAVRYKLVNETGVKKRDEDLKRDLFKGSCKNEVPCTPRQAASFPKMQIPDPDRA